MVVVFLSENQRSPVEIVYVGAGDSLGAPGRGPGYMPGQGSSTLNKAQGMIHPTNFCSIFVHVSFINTLYQRHGTYSSKYFWHGGSLLERMGLPALNPGFTD